MNEHGQQFVESVSDVENELRNALESLNRAGAKIDYLKGQARDNTQIDPSALGIALFGIKGLYEELDKATKAAYHFADLLSKNVIPERLRLRGMDGCRVPAIGRSFTIQQKTSASMLDKEGAMKWLRETGQGDMVQETVNAGTLASFCRNLMLEEGREPPEDLIKVSTYDVTSMVKYRPKKGEL